MTADEQEQIDRVASRLRQEYYEDPTATLQWSMEKAMWRRMAIAAIEELDSGSNAG